MAVLTEEQEARRKEAMAVRTRENQQARAKALVFGDYKVCRFDEYNWAYQKMMGGGVRDWYYYPTFASALEGVYHAMLGDAVLENRSRANEVKGILDAIQAVRQEILRGLTETI